jgi:MFS family permease
MSERQRRLLLVAITLGGFLGAFAVSATNIALPLIQSEFGLSAAGLSWIPLAYVLATAAALMPMGRIADMSGHKRSLVWGLRAFTILMLATALAPSAGALMGLRAAQGIAGAVVITSSTAILTLAYPPEERGRVLGLFAAGPYLGLMLGPVIGGIIVQNGGWRVLFLAAGTLSAANCLIPIWGLSGMEWRVPRRYPFDSLGAVLHAASLPSLLLGFTLMPTGRGTILMVAGLLGISAFLWWETRAADPLLNLRLFQHNRVLGFSNLAALVNYAATAGVVFLMSLYLQYTRGLSPQSAGLVLLAGALVQAAFSPIAGRAADRANARFVASGGMALCVLGLLGLVFVGTATPYWYIVSMMCLLGLGFAFFASPITYVVMGSVAPRHVGMASSTLATVRWTGNNLSIALAGMILAAVVGGETIEPGDYPLVLPAVRMSYVVFTALCAVGLIALLLGPERFRRPPVPA